MIPAAASLALVIPVRNDLSGLLRLLAQVSAARLADQVVVVDDGSDTPLTGRGLTDALGGIPLDLLRTDAGKGAGHARNLGFRAVRTDQVLFFDADDLFTDAFGPLRRSLQRQEFDIALFAHDDSRRLANGQRGPDESLDRAIWDDLALANGLRPMTMADSLALVRISNYPWNKIFNTAFARRIGLHFTEIPVHNDIEAHWTAFLEAGTRLVSATPAVVHTVAPTGSRLTNRRGPQRLQVFAALDAVGARLIAVSQRDPSGAAFGGPFLNFVLRLGDWIETTLDESEEQQQFRDGLRGFLTRFAAAAPPSLSHEIEHAFDIEPGFAPRFNHWCDRVGL